MTDAPVCTALVGYGFAGRVIHAPLLAATPRLAVTDVVTADPERAAAARAAHPGVTVHPTYDALLAATRPDLVVIASPNAAHVPQGLAAVERGIPVVVDKPLAVTAEDGRKLVDAARSAGVPLTVFQNRRWDCEHQTLRHLRDQETLGQLIRYEARFERWRPVPKRRWREELPSAEGGGLLMDLQSHLVDGAVDLFGPVMSVYAELSSVSTVADDVAFLALRHASGVRSHLGATSLAGAPGPRTRVLGTAGTYVVGGVDGEEAITGSSWFDESPEQRGWLVRGEERTPVPARPAGWAGFYPAVVEWLRGGATVPVDPRDAVVVLDVLEAARRSAATGETVSLSPAPAG